MYEINLSNEELRSYYDVLMNSESTANQEEESRKLHETVSIESTDINENNDANSEKEITPAIKERKSFIPKTWSSLKKNIIAENKQKSQSDDIMEAVIENNEPKDATKAIFGFNEMLESIEKNVYNIIKHDLKFIPIQCTAQFLKSDLKTKARILYAYHSKLHDIRDHLARQSLFAAPVPKATVNVNHQASSLENVDFSETYVSRSGRQTKRKIYYDENSLDDDFENATSKKTKNKDDWSDKSVSIRSDKGKTTEKQISYSNKLSLSSEDIVENLNDAKTDIEDENKIVDTDKTINEGKIQYF